MKVNIDLKFVRDYLALSSSLSALAARALLLMSRSDTAFQPMEAPTARSPGMRDFPAATVFVVARDMFCTDCRRSVREACFLGHSTRSSKSYAIKVCM